MNDLIPEARAIFDAARDGDAPPVAARARVQRAILSSLAAGAVITVAAKAGAGAAVGKSAAAAAGKGAAAAASTIAVAAPTATVAGKAITVLIIVGAVGTGLGLGPTMTGTPATQPAAGVSASPSASVADARRARAPSGAKAARGAPAPSTPVEGEERAEPAPPLVEPRPLPEAAGASPDRAAPPEKASAGTSARSARRTAAAPRAADAEPPSTLEAETRLLREVHGALESGQPERALALLDNPSAAYARGELQEERAASRVLALCKLARTGEASAAAARFLRDNPRSPIADRVRAACSPAPASPEAAPAAPHEGNAQ